MIDSLLTLVTDPSFPSLHVLIVHFPIALICLAPLFDLGCLVFRDTTWLDRTASALYAIGAISAGAAYLSGGRAAKALSDLSPAAESALADHESMAIVTLIALAAATVARLWVSWLARDDRRISFTFFRLAAIPLALVALALLALTADHGGKLVYGHGLGSGFFWINGVDTAVVQDQVSHGAASLSIGRRLASARAHYTIISDDPQADTCALMENLHPDLPLPLVPRHVLAADR